MTETVLQARGLARTYSTGDAEVPALRGVDLDVARGAFVAVMGPSGCGKSTLLHLLSGLDRPTAGTVELDGRRVESLSEAAWAVARRREIGFVFQFFNLVGNLTIAENVELPARLVGSSRREARVRRVELLQRLGVTARDDALPSQLSGGQQQRVALARALINRPTVLMADEPTGNLDTDSARTVLELLREVQQEGQTVLLVTHDPRVAARSDSVVTMRDGLIVDQTALSERPDPETAVSQLWHLEL